MLYNPPTGGGPNDPFVGKNVAAGQQGSRIPPKAVEAPQRELVAIVNESLQTPTNDDYKQVLRGIRGGRLWSYTDTSTVANPDRRQRSHRAYAAQQAPPPSDLPGQREHRRLHARSQRDRARAAHAP